jgi:nitrite reductase/ring-hydroxylating ferredoxin subunit
MFLVLKRLIDRQGWLDTAGDSLQKHVNTLFEQRGDNGKRVRNFLYGVWLGHPLHPLVTDMPVGAWTAPAVLDTVASISDDSLALAADITLATGLAAEMDSALTEVTDWKDNYSQERKVGLLHGMTRVASILTYTASLIVRLTGSRSTGVALGNAGYAPMAAGAYLGGDEVYDIGYGVNHTAFQHRPSTYTAIMPEARLEAKTLTKPDAGGVPVLLVKQGNQIYALDDVCVHAGCSLAEGKLADTSVICACHGSQYDLRDGSVINGPATMPQPHYDVRVQAGMIEAEEARA